MKRTVGYVSLSMRSHPSNDAESMTTTSNSISLVCARMELRHCLRKSLEFQLTIMIERSTVSVWVRLARTGQTSAPPCFGSGAELQKIECRPAGQSHGERSQSWGYSPSNGHDR